jgi:hypothetical protein
MIIGITDQEYLEVKQWLEDHSTSKEEANMNLQDMNLLKPDMQEPLCERHISMSAIIYKRMVMNKSLDGRHGWYTWGGLVAFLKQKHIWGANVDMETFWETITKTKNKHRYHFSYEVMIMDGDKVLVKVRPWQWQDSWKTNGLDNKKREATKQSVGSEGEAKKKKSEESKTPFLGKWVDGGYTYQQCGAEAGGLPGNAAEDKRDDAEQVGQSLEAMPGQATVRSAYVPPPPNQQSTPVVLPNVQGGNSYQHWGQYGANAWGNQQGAQTQESTTNSGEANKDANWNQGAWWQPRG